MSIVLASFLFAVAFASVMGLIMFLHNWIRKHDPVIPKTPAEHRLHRRIKIGMTVAAAFMVCASIAMVYLAR